MIPVCYPSQTYGGLWFLQKNSYEVVIGNSTFLSFQTMNLLFYYAFHTKKQTIFNDFNDRKLTGKTNMKTKSPFSMFFSVKNYGWNSCFISSVFV